MSHYDKNIFVGSFGKEKLSKEAKAKISSLSVRQPVPFLFQMAMAWFVIILLIVLAVLIHHIYFNIFVIFLIATRQNVLGLLIHEQTHCLGFKAKYGDLFTNFFAAYPLLLLTVEGYSQAHLSHHKFFLSEKDQDLIRKSGENWRFPMKANRLFKLFLADLLSLNLWKLLKGKKLNVDTGMFKRPNKNPAWLRPVYYVLIALLITYFQLWTIFLLFWVLPLITVVPMIVRWGAICEHLYIPNAKVEECSPIIILSWWEKLILPNLNFTLHPYHHYFPGVPFSNLPQIHQIFLDEGLVNKRNVFNGNYAYLNFLLQKEKLPATQNPIFENKNIIGS